MTAPLVLLIVGLIAVLVVGVVRSCVETPEVDHGVEVMKGGIEQ